jgi:hypothetical protein
LRWILFVVAIFWIALGTWANLYPVQVHGRLRSFVEGITPRLAAVVALVVGAGLVMAAPASSQGVGFVRLLGFVAMAKAIVFVLLPQERYQRLLNWWFAPVREQSWRVWGLVILVLGVALLSWL